MNASKGLGIEGKVRSALCAASHLAVEGPTDYDEGIYFLFFCLRVVKMNFLPYHSKTVL